MASPTVSAASFASRSEGGSDSRRSTNGRFGARPASLNRMSPSETTPTTWPPRSTTGRPEIPYSAITAAASFSVVSVRTVRTAVVITSLTFISASRYV